MMRAIDILRQARESNTRIKDIKRELDDINDMIASIKGEDPTGQAAINLIEISEKLEKESFRYSKSWKTACGIIEKIDSSKQQRVLRLRYLEGMSWSQIASIMGYIDGRSLQRLHQRAMISAQKVLDRKMQGI